MTRIGPIRYYKERVAYPSDEQLRTARATWDFDDIRRPTDDVDCTHIQLIEVSGRNAGERRQLEEEKLTRFFDYIGTRAGFRVLTHQKKPDSATSAFVSHEIVYVIESRPTRGYAKLTLRSELPRSGTAGAVSDIFSAEGIDRISRIFDKGPRRD